VANALLAFEHKLDIVPVLNKIDLASAQVDASAAEVEHVLGIQQELCIFASGKEGIGVDEILQAIVDRVRPPAGDPDASLRALIFDCKYDDYKGVITYVRIVDGQMKRGDKIRMHHSGKTFEIAEIGTFRPKPVNCDLLSAGDV